MIFSENRCALFRIILVGKDADHFGPPPDLNVEAFERIGRVQLDPVRGREAHQRASRAALLTSYTTSGDTTAAWYRHSRSQA